MYGHDLDVDRLMEATGLDEVADGLKVYRRGEPQFRKSQPDGPRNETSGINLCISDADFDDVERQVNDAIQGLQEDRDLIRTLRSYDGVDDAVLDFGINRRDCAVQCDYFPARLIALLGELGLSLEISLYPLSREAAGKP